MLKIFNLKKSKLNYHEKIIKNIKNTLSPLPQIFWDTDPIISGSYAIHLLFKPQVLYDDIDLYFESEEKLNHCHEILRKFASQYSGIETNSLNSTTYKFDFAKIQLVEKIFLSPDELIFDHDIKNVSIAIQHDSIYIDDEIFNLWYSDKLSIRNTQITDSMSVEKKMKKIANLYERVQKYTSRYGLNLDNHSKCVLSNLSAFLKTIDNQTKRETYVNTNLYYNQTYSPVQNNLLSIIEIQNMIDSTIAAFEFQTSSPSEFTPDIFNHF